MTPKLILASSVAGILVILCMPWYVAWGHLPGGAMGYGPPVYGYEYLQAEFTSVVLPLTWGLLLTFFFAACFSVATWPLVPTPVWRSGVVCAFGATCLLLSLGAMYQLERQQNVGFVCIGPYVTAAIGAGLVLLGSVEIGATLRASGSNSEVPDTAFTARPPLG